MPILSGWYWTRSRWIWRFDFLRKAAGMAYNRFMNTITLDQARAAKPRVHELLRDVPQLAGVGITRVGEGYAVKVNLSAASEDGIDLPTEVDGVPIRIEIVGQVRKRDSL
jgi:hypothetical protein